MLSYLVYYSIAREAQTLSSLQALTDTSARNNSRRGITGLLYYADGYFLQGLEGDRSEISELYQRICRDERHHNVTLLAFSSSKERIFPRWSMRLAKGSVSNESSYHSILVKYGFDACFLPQLLSSKRALCLLSELAYDIVSQEATVMPLATNEMHLFQ